MARRRFLLYKVVDISITGIMLFCICRCSFTGNSIKQMNHWTDGSRPETRTNWDNLIISGSIFHPVILLSVHLILCSIPSHPFSDHSPWREKGKVPGTEKCFKMAEQKSPHTVQCTGGPIPELTTMNLQYTAAQQVDDNLYQVWLMYWKEGWMETPAFSCISAFFLLLGPFIFHQFSDIS